MAVFGHYKPSVYAQENRARRFITESFSEEVMFCPKCKSIMKPVKEGNRVVLRCGNCNLNFDTDKTHSIQDMTLQIPKHEQRSMEAVDESHNVLAVHSHKCSKCGYAKAEIIEKGIWYSDEDHVVLYRCGKCGHTEMEADKVK